MELAPVQAGRVIQYASVTVVSGAFGFGFLAGTIGFDRMDLRVQSLFR